MPRKSPELRLAVLGDVYVDYAPSAKTVRLGGVFHAARALQALEIPYAVGYTSPEYLASDVSDYLNRLGCETQRRLGTVTGAPSLIVSADVREAGPQGYDEILRDSKKTSWDPSSLYDLLRAFRPTDVLVIPGALPLRDILRIVVMVGARIHVDVQYDVRVGQLKSIGVPFETTFISTSTAIFQSRAHSDPEALRKLFGSTVSRSLILKENRGGSRVFLETGRIAEAPAFPTRTAHSVGVGDCFDCIWIARRKDTSPPRALALASYGASLYASTWDQRQFRDQMSTLSNATEASTMCGTRIRWEDRPNYRIYIAAPDFPDVDTSGLDRLCASLAYHNFVPLRPIAEHGLYTGRVHQPEAKRIYNADLELLQSSHLVVVVPLINDPGTFVELGVASSLGIPTILWDPNGIANNLFAWHTANRRCQHLHEVIDAAFAALVDPTAARWTK